MNFKVKDIDLIKYKPYTIGFSLIILAILISTWIIVLTAVAPLRRTRLEALTIVREKTDLVSYSDFSIYNGQESYYVVKGKNKAGEEHLLLISQETKDITDYSVEDGISKKDAVKVAKENGAKGVSQVSFGEVEEKAIWEVEDKGTFYLIDFQSGEFVKKVG